MKAPKAASLLLVFVLAKAAALGGHHVPLSWWAPIAYLWQDAVVVLIFGAIELCLGRRQRAVWTVYAAFVLYTVINIPVERALSTPLTMPMWRAAGGALADSMWYYVTWQNALLVVSVALVAVMAPLVIRRRAQGPLLDRPNHLASVGPDVSGPYEADDVAARHGSPDPYRLRNDWGGPLAAVLVICVALGPAASTRVDTVGLERNAWAMLISSALPHIPSRASTGDWRATKFDHTRYEDLSRFGGAAAGRNIVLISLESTAAQYLGLYGATPDVTPNLSELARTAIVFESAYAVYPESIKGLFSILCSTYPAFDSSAEIYAGVPCQSVAAVLSGNGYRTALFHSGRFMYLGMESVIRNRGFETLADAGDIGGHHNSSFGVDEPSTVARILSWIDQVPAGQPFFVTYLPIAGHHPYETPEPGPYQDRDEFGRYRNALHYGDASLGTLIRGIRARGLEQKTLWIVLGDHGEAFGQHEGNYGHTFQLYDENVRVPFLISVPGLIQHQIRSRQVVSLIDTAPTLLNLAGAGAPKSYQGRSMLDGAPRTALFFADYSSGMLGLRDGPRKFIYELDTGRSKLFDLESNPQETTDISARFFQQARWYSQDLRAWSSAQKHLLSAAK